MTTAQEVYFIMYERLEKIKKRRAKLSSLGVAKLDKKSLALGGYTHFIIGLGIEDQDSAEFVEVPGQESQVKVDYPFPGKFPSLEKGQITLDPISWAKDFTSFLKACPVEIDPYELMVGDAHWNMWTLRGRKFPNATKLAFLRKKANDLGGDGVGWARNSPDFDMGLSLGWEGIQKKIVKYLEEFHQQGKEKEVEYLKASKIVCEAMRDFIKGYAKVAKALSEGEKDNRIKKIYEKVAKACKNISNGAPSSFYEALLWISFYALVDRSAIGPCAGYGRIDMVLKSFYCKDIESKRITEEEAQELVAEFIHKRPYWYCISGRDKNLKDATNEVSWLFLNACDMLQEFINLAVMWHEDINEDFFHRACEIEIKNGSGTPMLMNHDVMRKSVINYGIKEEDAWNVAYNGCAWYSVPGKEYLCGDIAGINLTICLMNALDLAFKVKINSFNELWELFSIEVEEAVKALKDLIDEELEQFPKIWPEILPSLLHHGCIENGRDITELGVEYNFPTIQMVGVSNAADSLAAIQRIVFNKKIVSLETLEQALNNNFKGYEYVRGHLLNCPKFGNDENEPDEIAAEVVNLFREKLSKYKSRNGFDYRPAIWSHLGHIYAGKMIEATPDGRKRGEPLAQGPNPMHGRNLNGITATAGSIARLKPWMLLECPYQLELDPYIFNGLGDKSKVKLMGDIISSCFKMGLVQVQGNIFTLEKLKEALKKPEEYRNLMVRVTGFSARFVEMSKEAQKEIMSRYRESSK